MTGLRGDQVAELTGAVFDLLGGVWQPVRGRRRVLGLYRAVVLALFVLRRNESQAVAGELLGCSQSSVSRIVRRLRPLLRQVTADLAGQVRQQAKRSAVLVDGFLAPTGNRAGVPDLFSGKRHAAGLNVQAVSDLAGRLVDTGLPVPGARHDSKALTESGIADRWASHLQPDGPGMLADLGYLGARVGNGQPAGWPQGEGWSGPGPAALGRGGCGLWRRWSGPSGAARATAHRLGQPGAMAGPVVPAWRKTLSRLWQAASSRHSPRAPSMPRRRSRRPFWTVVIWPKTGSTMALRRR
jgi:hypothetical protein